MNPLFGDMEHKDIRRDTSDEEGGGRKGVREEGDAREGVLFVNQLAEEEEEEREGGRETREEIGEGAHTEKQNVWQYDEDGEEDFILEPPEDFSQVSGEREEEIGLPLGMADDLYNPSESQCTSIDDF